MYKPFPWTPFPCLCAMTERKQPLSEPAKGTNVLISTVLRHPYQHKIAAMFPTICE